MIEGEYKPFKPEKTIIVTLTIREADLIQKLRTKAYGKFTVHKANGVLIRIEINETQLIQDDAEINIEP